MVCSSSNCRLQIVDCRLPIRNLQSTICNCYVTLLVTPVCYNSTYEFVQEEREMCGRYSLVPTESIAARFDIQQQQLTLSPRYNVAPSQSMPVVVRNSPNRLVEMQWGLIPSWSKEPRAQFS